MIADLGRYSAYKECGVPWLGEVPEHWAIRRLRNSCEMRVSNVDKHRKDDELPVRLCNYMDVYKNDRISSALSFMRATATAQEIERFRLRAGDVLITKDSEKWNDIGVPALVDGSEDDIVSGYHLALLRPIRECLDGRYLFRALQSPAVAYQLHINANGVTRFGLSHDAIKSLWVPLPPLAEQAAIVRFLDQADRRIRRYIRAKQKLIALLEEHKQAIIHQAVTGQIDVRTGKPHPAYKDSGVEWLEDIPMHWQMRRVGHFSRVGNGSTPARGNHSYWSGGEYPWLNSSSVNQDTIAGADQFVTELALRECHLPLVRPGSVLVGITGQGKTRGMAAVLTIEATINQHMAYITPTTGEVSSNYLQLFLSAAYKELRAISSASGSTKGALTCEDVRFFKVAIPPIDEQERLVSAVRQDLEHINAGINCARLQIHLMREYRTRLVADVVTGKLDVREVAARLPNEVQEPEATAESEAHADIGNEVASKVHAGA